MTYLRNIVRRVRKRLNLAGFDIVRYPQARSDTLWPAWVRLLSNDGPISVVFDVGANRGQTLKWFRPIFPVAEMYAFEPYPEAFKELSRLASSDSKVHPVQLALGEQAGEATLYENSSDTTNSLLPNSPETELYTPAHMCQPIKQSLVQVERLDVYCQKKDIEAIDVLKLDVQGFELAVLKGAGEMLKPSTIRSVYLEVLFVSYYNNQCWADEIISFLRERGYRLYGFSGVSYDEKQGWRWADAMFVPAEHVKPASSCSPTI